MRSPFVLNDAFGRERSMGLSMPLYRCRHLDSLYTEVDERFVETRSPCPLSPIPAYSLLCPTALILSEGAEVLKQLACALLPELLHGSFDRSVLNPFHVCGNFLLSKGLHGCTLKQILGTFRKGPFVRYSRPSIRHFQFLWRC